MLSAVGLGLFLVIPGSAPAADRPVPGEAHSPELEEAARPTAADTSDDDWEDLESDPCAVGERGNWVDWMDQSITRSVCSTARWFDDFFGTPRLAEERDATFGRVGLGVAWDEDDGIDDVIRFRTKLHLPNTKNRVSVFAGGGSEEELDDDEVLDGGAGRDLFFSDEDEWLLGFGVSPVRSDRKRVTFGVGARFSNGVDPYVRLKLIRRWLLGERHSLRIRLTPQWQESRRLGASSSISLERTLGHDFLLRYEILGQAFEKRFDGVAYSAGVVLYQNLGRGRAMRYGVSASGESDRETQPEDAGFVITYRDSIYKETLFLETFAGASWRRRAVDDEREPKVILGLLFELKFGH